MMKNLTLLFGLLLSSSSVVAAQNECNPNPPDGLPAIQSYSIFHSNYRGGDFAFALKYGRWMMCAKPMTMEGFKGFNLSTQYDKFVKIYQGLAENTNEPALKAAYLDSAVIALDDKMELFGKENNEVAFEVLQQKGRFYLQNYTLIEDGLSKAYQEFQNMFDLDPEKATTEAKGYYIDNLLRNYVTRGDREKAQVIINGASQYASPDLQAKIDEYQKDLFESPEDIIDYYGPILEQDPNNLEALNALLGAYEEQDDRDNMEKISRKLYEVNPTFDTALSLADIERGNARYTEAAEFYKEALELASNDDDKKSINLSIAEAYISMEQLQTARRYTREALKIDSNYGLAYIKMATIYAQSVIKCTEERKIEAQDRIVYWLVIDYLNMAKNKDRSVANTVSSQLPNYTAVTPSTEDKFLKLGLKDGDTVKIDGSLMDCYSWINETTTVR